MSCGVGRGYSSDPALLWLWRRPLAAAPIGPLAWEPPYATGVALEKTNKKICVCVCVCMGLSIILACLTHFTGLTAF